MSERKTRLVDCNPRWVDYQAQNADGRFHGESLQFDCPEGHIGCWHTIPFTPELDGSEQSGVRWQRTGATFETLTLLPSIKRTPRHASREAAIAAGCLPGYITDSLLCAFHGFVKDGQIEFCGDSR